MENLAAPHASRSGKDRERPCRAGGRRELLSFAAAGLVLALAGCAASAPIKQVARLTPLTAEKPGARVVELKKLVIKVPAGTSVGALQGGLGCLSLKELNGKAGRAFVTEAELGSVFREELSAAGYVVAGDPYALFEEETELRPDFYIAGLIKDLKANLCSGGVGLGSSSRAKGDASLAVDWQIYSNRTQKVELSATTEGTGHLAHRQQGGGIQVFRLAFQGALRNLLADQEFHTLIAGVTGEEAPARVAQESILVPFETARPASNRTIESVVADSRLGVVTVFAGDAFGSGFLISSDGYLLTNQHVVGKSRYVKVRFVTGREVNGEVVRADRTRDVALVKLETDIYRPLPLGNTSAVAPGTEVLAIGTPWSEELGQTVTSGIVSGYGQEDGQRIIRSDVGIHRGNSGGPLLMRSGAVVGIAVSGVVLMPQGLGVGLNSFIPIEEAIEVLGIRAQADASKPDVNVASKSAAVRP